MSEQLADPNILPTPELSVFTDNISLQTRLLLGGQAINPDQLINTVDPSQLENAENDKFTYDCLRKGSLDERQTFWQGKGTFDAQKTIWKNHLAQQFTNRKEFYTTSESGKKQAEALKKIGIDSVNFSADSAEAIYQQWCSRQDGTTNFDEFIDIK